MNQQNKQPIQEEIIHPNKWRSRILALPFIVLFLLLLSLLINEDRRDKTIELLFISSLFVLGVTAVGIWLAKIWAYTVGLAISLILLVGGLILIIFVLNSSSCEGLGCLGAAFIFAIYIAIVAIGLPTGIFLWLLIKDKVGIKKAGVMFFVLLILTVVLHSIILVKPHIQEQEIVKLVGESSLKSLPLGFEEKGSRMLKYDKRVIDQEFFRKNPFAMTIVVSRTLGSDIPFEFTQYQGTDVATVGKEIKIREDNGYHHSIDGVHLLVWKQNERMFRIECRCSNGVGEAGMLRIAEAVSDQFKLP